MRDNLRHAVSATLLIIWRRIARTPFASIGTVLVTYPNNVLPMSNAVYVRRRVTKPLIVNCRGLGAYLHIALRTLNLLLSLLRITLAMIMKLLPLLMIFRPSWMSNVKKMVMVQLEFRMFMMMMMLMIMMILVIVMMMMMLMLIMLMVMLLLTMIMTWMMVIPVTKLLPVYMLITMSLRRIPSWGQGNDPEKMTIFLTCSVNLRNLKIPDHCSPCESLRYLLFHLLKRLLNLLPSDFVLLMFKV